VVTPTAWADCSPPEQRAGLLAESVTQAVARDRLAAALVRLEAAGEAVILHVHDEVAAGLRSKADLGSMTRLCEQLPSWANGLPVEAEGFTCQRYRKG
jgi:DNA polymerase